MLCTGADGLGHPRCHESSPIHTVRTAAAYGQNADAYARMLAKRLAEGMLKQC